LFRVTIKKRIWVIVHANSAHL